MRVKICLSALDFLGEGFSIGKRNHISSNSLILESSESVFLCFTSIAPFLPVVIVLF